MCETTYSDIISCARAMDSEQESQYIRLEARKAYEPFDPNKDYPCLPVVAKRVKRTWYKLPKDKGYRFWDGNALRNQKYLDKQKNRTDNQYRQKTDEQKLNDKKRRMQKDYGISPEQYIDMFVQNNYGCHICDKPLVPYSKDACVDHLHGTGKYYKNVNGKRQWYDTKIPAVVRGILCQRCNFAMHHYDDPQKHARAIQYRDKKRRTED